MICPLRRPSDYAPTRAGSQETEPPNETKILDSTRVTGYTEVTFVKLQCN